MLFKIKFLGEKCSSKCDDDKWGDICDKDCDCSGYGSCEQHTGNCICKNGRRGKNCKDSNFLFLKIYKKTLN